MSKRKAKLNAAIPITPTGADLLRAEKSRAMREAIAAELECMLGMGEFDDACECMTLDDRNDVTRIVSGLIAHVRLHPEPIPAVCKT
jgi:hypothetical protein